MDLLERARRLKKLGFFAGFEDKVDPAELVRETRAELADLVEEAPATALLIAAGLVIEIEADAAAELAGYGTLLQEIAEFCDDTFQVSEVRAEFVKGKRVPAGEEGGGEEGKVVRLRFRLDDKPHEVEVTHFPDLIDLSFISEINTHLALVGEKRRLVPILELVDDTARYVFVEPKKMDKAEEDDVVASPDFEGES